MLADVWKSFFQSLLFQLRPHILNPFFLVSTLTLHGRFEVNNLQIIKHQVLYPKTHSFMWTSLKMILILSSVNTKLNSAGCHAYSEPSLILLALIMEIPVKNRNIVCSANWKIGSDVSSLSWKNKVPAISEQNFFMQISAVLLCFENPNGNLQFASQWANNFAKRLTD